ncbi:Hpt domain-containing protein [Sphingomonas hengshuiensis]|uniref:Histidine phosphotransferase n=1 Tax=Sphingomonas hengshuiensis TaxID=1609977 RepID=A0A7U4J9K7_9SPHN|nr:Hpt domain-containing protein [Sphingomonas hengshuiensis]AJP72754.1 histidine phosphotransferase [Sphingomonas hengshuiensis]
MDATVGRVPLVEGNALSQARAELGASFARILGYFREDGVKSVSAIEAAMRAQNAAALVIPAHTLKGDALQFGAEPLADLAEAIEFLARDCVEQHEAPTQALALVAQLRPLFEATLELLERETNPLVSRRPAFGRRAAAGA